MNIKNKNNNRTNGLVYACSLGILITIALKRSGINLGDNLQYIYLNGSPISFPEITILFGLIFGIFGSILSYFISVILRKKVYEEITKEFPQDKIIFKYYPTVIPTSIAQFAIVGGMMGGYIAPFFLFNEVSHIDMVTRTNLPFYIAYTIIGFLICVIWEAYTYFLTDKRVISATLFKSIIIKKIIFPFKDIKTIKPIIGGWEIINKDNEKLPLKFNPNAKEFQAKLKKILKMEDV